MIWQDVLITIATITFALALIPQVYHGYKNKVGSIQIQTSLPTFLGLYVICFAFFTLSLFYSAIITFCTGTLWLILFMQRLTYSKKE